MHSAFARTAATASATPAVVRRRLLTAARAGRDAIVGAHHSSPSRLRPPPAVAATHRDVGRRRRLRTLAEPAAAPRRRTTTRRYGLGGVRGVGAPADNAGGTGTEAETDEAAPAPTSWPSCQHATFAFAKLARPRGGSGDSGGDVITLPQFLSVIDRMRLDFNLSRVELERVFRQLDENGDGLLSLEEFQLGRATSPFTKALVEALSGGYSDHVRGEDDGKGWTSPFPDPDFDTSLSTAEFYRAPMRDGFVGENVDIRRCLDYGYHGNYTHERQRFQDRLIRTNVLLDGNGTARPWLVHTCGPMGAGKGYVLGWMSANGILPLEHVSKVDPDAFKSRMPEWQLYQRSGCENDAVFREAGTLTHAESGYVAEIAQRVAMRNSMNVWVDGSLRNYEWYAHHFDAVREKYPHYRIAILAIDAPESTIRSRLEDRARVTGRHVPAELSEQSARGIEEGLRRLTPKVDLIASVSNESGFGNHTQPELKAVSMIDSSGNWELIKSLTTFGNQDGNLAGDSDDTQTD